MKGLTVSRAALAVTIVCLATRCSSPSPTPIGERYIRVAVLDPARPPDPCFLPRNSVYELRPDSQWIAVDSVVVTCHKNDAAGGVYAFGPHYATAWGSFARYGQRLWLASDSVRQDDGAAEENHFSRAAELHGDSLVFLTGIEMGPAMIYLRIRPQ